MSGISRPRVLACKVNKILSVLENVIKDEGKNPRIDSYPVLIGSTAARWHIPSFRFRYAETFLIEISKGRIDYRGNMGDRP